MKSFIKKLSVIVIAATMVLAALPAINANAGSLALGDSKATTRQTHDILVGEVLDLNFYGAKGYVERVDSHNVVWKSSNPEIATVDRVGKVKGIKVGTTTITVSASVAATGQSYSGSVKVNVREIDKGFEAELVKFVGGKATVELIFKDEANARANQKNIEVTRVRVTKIKRIDLKTSVDSVKLNSNKLVVTFPASEGVTYCLTVKNVGSVDKLIATGKPVDAFISCNDVVVATKDDKDPRNTANNRPTTDVEKIKCEVTDENGVIVAEFIGKDVSNVNAKLKSATVSYTNLLKKTSITSKTVTLSKQGDEVVIKGDFSCQVGTEKVKLETNEITVRTINYQYPSGLDFALDVQAVDLDADTKKITYSENSTFSATMNVRESKQIVYVFEATDVNNNTGLYTGKTGYAYCSDESNKVSKLYTDFKFALNPEVEHKVIVSDTGKITAIRGGQETVYIYTNDGKDDLVGFLEVTVLDEPVLTEMVLSETYLQGYNNADPESAKGPFEMSLFDQNGDPISYESVRGRLEWSNEKLPSGWLKGGPKEGFESVYSCYIDFTKVPATDGAESITTDIIFHNGLGEEVRAEITLDSYTLTAEEEEGYAISVSDVTLTNKKLVDYKNDESKDPNPVIKVMKTLAGVNVAEVGTYVMEGVPEGAEDDEHNLIVDLPNYMEYKASKNELNEGIYIAIYKDGQQVTKDCDGTLIKSMSATEAGRKFSATSLTITKENQILSGTYEVKGWKVTQNGARQDVEQIESAEFTVTKDIKGLEDLEPVYTVDPATGKRTSTISYNPAMCATTNVKELLSSIFGSFYVKYDHDFDGKYDENEFARFNETADMRKLFDSIDITKDEYILASDGKSVYIKSFTLNFKVGNILVSEHWQVNKNFVTNKYEGEEEDYHITFAVR